MPDERRVTESDTPSAGGLRHQPALDGVRAVAVLMVMAYHASSAGFPGGRAGVDVFFVLSGFLITALLLDERSRTGTIRLRDFCMRRMLRLYPALIAAIALAVVLAALKIRVFSASSNSLGNTLDGVPFSLLYTMNIARAAGWTGGGFLAHTWSLAIEEQFYLLWPIVVVVVMRRTTRLPVVGAIAVACAVSSAALRTGLDAAGVDGSVVFNATITHVDGIFAGCALGVAWAARRDIVAWLARPVVSAAAAIGAAIVLIRGESMYSYGFLVIVVASVVLTANLLIRPRSGLGRLLSHRSLVAIGRRSYGLYLFHWPIFQFLGVDTRPLILLIGFAATFAAAWLSFGIIEQPFLRMKRRWTSRPPVDAEAVPCDPSGPVPAVWIRRLPRRDRADSR